jgi:transcriptional regulator with XRE-family HTH domain
MTPEQFRNIRADMGLSQHKLALLLGYEDRSTISNFENGRRMITPRLEKLVLAMSVAFISDKTTNGDQNDKLAQRTRVFP